MQFGPEDKDNFIFNKRTKDKVYLRKQNGVYLLDVMFPNGSWSEITVDSGAADNVCPWGWAECFNVQNIQAKDRINFMGPDGSPISRYGSKDVMVKAVSSSF